LFFVPVAKGQSPTAADRTPVLVELFTSEGCSDCPPADAILAQLDAKQVVPGADAIVLSEHVTYWNHQGWNDPFSLIDVDQRQDEYVQRFSLPSPATPQFVVDGAAQVAGADAHKLVQEISDAAKVPKLAIEIDDPHRDAEGSIEFSVRAAPSSKATLMAAVAENATQSAVSGGENSGRTLHHVAVVRAVKEFGSNAADGRPLRLSGGNLLRAEKDGELLRLVVFLVNRSSGHVLAVAEQTLAH
jgi:hypothetical protein